MGRIVTPKYRLEMQLVGFLNTSSVWDVTSRGMIKGKGKPTADNLRKEVEAFEASTRPGGVNAHLGPIKVSRAEIIHQKSGATVAQYEAAV